ncbi:hypothetical protein DFJ73DRAFT_968011 [Zopfochytrium polystomum]|nr:hypothetical protein DFJ73DRAFT_968011 [Zopfochytrium polystomum]
MRPPAPSPTNRPMGPMSGLFSLFLRNAIERTAAAADPTAQATSPQSASSSPSAPDGSSDMASRVDSEQRSGTRESMSEDEGNDSDDEFGPPVRDSSAADSDDEDEETSDLTLVFRNLFGASEPPRSPKSFEDRTGTPRPLASSPLLPLGHGRPVLRSERNHGADSSKHSRRFRAQNHVLPVIVHAYAVVNLLLLHRPPDLHRLKRTLSHAPRHLQDDKESGTSPADEQSNVAGGGGNGAGPSGRASGGGADLLFHLLLSLLSRVSAEDIGGSLFGDGPESYEEFLRLAELLGPARPRFHCTRSKRERDGRETATFADELKDGGDLDSAVPDPTVTVNHSQIPLTAERDTDTAPRAIETSSFQQTEDVSSVTWGIKDLLAATKEKCTICLRPYEEGESLRIMRCRHGFHAECIDQLAAEPSSAQSAQPTLGESNGLPVQGPLLPPGHHHPATRGGSDFGDRSPF